MPSERPLLIKASSFTLITTQHPDPLLMTTQPDQPRLVCFLDVKCLSIMRSRYATASVPRCTRRGIQIQIQKKHPDPLTDRAQTNLSSPSKYLAHVWSSQCKIKASSSPAMAARSQGET